MAMVIINNPKCCKGVMTVTLLCYAQKIPFYNSKCTVNSTQLCDKKIDMIFKLQYCLIFNVKVIKIQKITFYNSKCTVNSTQLCDKKIDMIFKLQYCLIFNVKVIKIRISLKPEYDVVQ